MLNKDQYNQDAYNDVYTEATADAEIKYSKKDKGKSKLLLIFLLLSLIATLGYFVWQNLNAIKGNNSNIIEIAKPSSQTKDNSLELDLQKTLLSIDEDEKKENDKKAVEKIDSSTADIVANVAKKTGDTKMSPTDIARIVQLVTEQMKAEKKVEETKVVGNPKAKDSLETSLENFEIDTLSSESLMGANIDGSQKKEASNVSNTSTYNKIVIEKSNKNSKFNDELSQLSMEISNVINSNVDKSSDSNESTEYTSSLSKEVHTRKKEMRYHIVQKGDTLATIAEKIYGSSQDYIKLYEANPDILRRADKIYIGQKLRIPE